LQFWRVWTATTADEVSSFAILGFVPAMDEIPAEYHHQETLIFMAMYAGDPEEGKKVLAPFANFTKPIVDFSDVMPYVQVQQTFDADYPAGQMHYYWKSRYLAKLDDNAIDTLIAVNAKAVSHHSTLDIWQMGGAPQNAHPDVALRNSDGALELHVEVVFGGVHVPIQHGVSNCIHLVPDHRHFHGYFQQTDDHQGRRDRRLRRLCFDVRCLGIFVHFPGVAATGLLPYSHGFIALPRPGIHRVPTQLPEHHYNHQRRLR
jgi:hypothetical protein